MPRRRRSTRFGLAVPPAAPSLCSDLQLLRPLRLLHASPASPRCVAANPMPGRQRSSLLCRQPSPPPRFFLSEILCPSNRAVSKDTCVGGGGAISPPFALPPPQCPPLGLLPDPHHARITGVSIADHEEVGGHLASSASIPGPTRPGPRGRCQKAPES